jgi:hypothetical protein
MGVLWRFRGLRGTIFSGVSDAGEGEFSGGSEVRGGTGSQEVRCLWVGLVLKKFSDWTRAGSLSV